MFEAIAHTVFVALVKTVGMLFLGIVELATFASQFGIAGLAVTVLASLAILGGMFALLARYA